MRMIDNLMVMMFGEDHFMYEYDVKKTCHVSFDSHPTYVYKRQEWLEEYNDMASLDKSTAEESEYNKSSECCLGECMCKCVLGTLMNCFMFADTEDNFYQ